MLNIKATEFLIKCISFIIAYAWIVTIPNVVQAWVAYWAGDDTARRFEFTSFNPINHIDFFGFIMLIVSCGYGSPLGWGRSVYIDPFNIKSRLRLFLVSFADVMTHILSALLLLVLLELIFGLPVVGLFYTMIVERVVSHRVLADLFPAVNSLSIVFGFIILVAIYLHLLLGILYAILNGRDFYLVCKASDPMDYAINRIKPSNLFIPLILLFLFAEPLRLLVVNCITYVGLFIGLFLGL